MWTGRVLSLGYGVDSRQLAINASEAPVVAQIRTVLTSPESIALVVRHILRHSAQIDEATTVMAMV
jgi:hypothetical protein